MARKGATAENVQRAIDGPDFDAALAIINGRIAEAKTRQQKASGDASQAWGSIEKLGVNKKGAQMFARVAAIEDEDDRQDQLRTFLKLCELEGIGIATDLMDIAEGKRPDPVPVKKPETAAPPPAPPGDKDLADDAADGPTEKLEKAKADGNVTSIAAAKARAVKHLGGKPTDGSIPDATD